MLRLLEPIAVTFDLARLGLEPEQADALERMLAKPSGAVLVGGPVGAGKTTTLYSCLERLNNPSLNVMTIEDPVECRFPAVNQVEIDTRIGLTFARGLRAILRQDPNILMIGEIRDDETAAIGMRAALTGVLVFSTIHAADAASTANSLRNYGVPGYTLANAVHGIVNQRLVRILCPACKAAFEPDEELLLSLRLDPAEYRGMVLHRAVGCPACLGTGYHGRTADLRGHGDRRPRPRADAAGDHQGRHPHRRPRRGHADPPRVGHGQGPPGRDDDRGGLPGDRLSRPGRGSGWRMEPRRNNLFD